MQEELLENPYVLEVINPLSDYFGEQFAFTHKVKAIGKIWYKAFLDYNPSEVGDLSVWFQSNELGEVQ